ncbi:efflux RND transporter periplasmic adaptor subunit [Candidatus Azambacteria bacterium]|nr:efflux RND transporter periplasmic adaptor subunit [Candidatus Azambacteria bacterium]
MIDFIKKRYIVILVSILAVFVFGFLYFGGAKAPAYESAIANRMNIVQEVSATGSIKPVDRVDLAFEISGKISEVFANVGDKVDAGKALAGLDKAELYAGLLQAKAGVDSVKAQLSQYEAALKVQQSVFDEMKKGTRAEEMQLAETKAENANKAFSDAKVNLTNIESKANIDLNNLYNDVDDILNDSYAKADDAVNKQISDLFSELVPNDPKLTFSVLDFSLKNKVEQEKYSAKNYLSSLKSEISGLGASSDFDGALSRSRNHLSSIRDFLSDLNLTVDSAIGLSSTTINTYRGYVNTAKTNVNTAISNINNQVQLIAAQKITNQNNIFSAESKVSDAESALKSAKDELALKKAGSTKEQLDAQANKVAQAEANVEQQKSAIKQAEASAESYKAKLSKSVLHSPISGTITKQDAKIGEVAVTNQTIISIINESAFKIEVNIPEADIAKIQVGNEAKVTLDAYGEDLIFKAKVSQIDPAETVIEGVSTYKTTLVFEDGNGKIKSGMTANINILAGEKKGVIAVPQRSLIAKNGDKFVRVINKDGSIEERKVSVGLRGSDGMTEILDGLGENERIVLLFK